MDILQDHSNWSITKDKTLVSFVDNKCRLLSTSPSRLMPDELHVTQTDLASQEYSLLQGNGNGTGGDEAGEGGDGAGQGGREARGNRRGKGQGLCPLSGIDTLGSWR